MWVSNLTTNARAPAPELRVKRALATCRPPPSLIPLRLVPEDLAQLTAVCNKCGNSQRPDWFEVKPEPLVPVKPADTPPEDPGRWVPHSMMFACERCGDMLSLEYPRRSLRARCSLFADEAIRRDDRSGREVFTYALVGGTTQVVDAASDALSKLKASLEPSLEPDAWRFHMRVLWSGQQRRKDRVFAHWQMPKVVDAVRGLARVVGESRDLHVYAASVVRRGPAVGAKRDAFVALTLKVVRDLTSQGGQPRFHFDSEKPAKGAHTVHAWAQRLFLDTQYCVLWAYLAHGIEVPEPQFVPPASHPCLELADFVAYVVARHHLDVWRGKKSETDPAELGPVTYLGFNPRGELVFGRQAGIPWELFR